jgi:hypothetical protein
VIRTASRSRQKRSEPAATRGAHWPALLSAAGGIVALVAVAAPLLITAVAIARQRPDAMSDGDQAADELALMRATHLAQLVGNYSRYEWNHPGPSWFYALDPIYVWLGSQTWSVTVAVLCLHAVIAGLIVALLWRRAGAVVALLTAGLLLLYVRTLGADVFRVFWPPYALMLPMILLFGLAAAGAAGSMPALAAAFVVGSFVAQLHVGTVPIVLAVLGSMVAVRLALHLLDRRAGATASGGRPRAAGVALWVGAALVLAALWLPVAVDQLTGRPGNITKLFLFFSMPHDTHPYGAAVSALARLLEVFPLRGLPDSFGPESSAAPLSRLAIVLAFAAAAAALAVLGARLRDRFALALGLLLLLAVPVVTISITRVVGPLYPYLFVWVTTFPLLLVAGWAALVARLRPWERWPLPARSALAAVLCVAVVGVAATRVTAFQRLPPALGDATDPGTRAAWAMTESALASEPRRTVRVVIADNDRWVIASGLILQLQKHGWTVTVNRPYVFIYGDATSPTGDEAVVLVVAAATDLPGVEGEMPDLRQIGRAADTYLLVGHTPTRDP